MTFLRRLFPSLCTHEHRILERRELHGLQVIHLVCECGHAVPAIRRDDAEYRAGLAQQVKAPKARKVHNAQKVVGLETRRGQR